jgi:hypothetical protein
MHVSSSLLPLTKVEKEYLDGTRELTKAQQRYIRCRLRKKLRLLNEQSCNVAAALSKCSNAAATLDLRNYNEESAGSGTFALPSRRKAREGNISNPRVLSDMGLAIPRPTRLGDPRSVETEPELNSVSVCASLSSLNIILTSLIGLILMAPPSWLLAATP